MTNARATASHSCAVLADATAAAAAAAVATAAAAAAAATAVVVLTSALVALRIAAEAAAAALVTMGGGRATGSEGRATGSNRGDAAVAAASVATIGCDADTSTCDMDGVFAATMAALPPAVGGRFGGDGGCNGGCGEGMLAKPAMLESVSHVCSLALVATRAWRRTSALKRTGGDTLQRKDRRTKSSAAARAMLAMLNCNSMFVSIALTCCLRLAQVLRHIQSFAQNGGGAPNHMKQAAGM